MHSISLEIDQNLSRADASPRSAGFFASPLRYPGGKGRLGPWLSTVIEANNLSGGWYVEPYAGGAGAALYLLMQGQVAHIVINDADPLVHAFWQSVVNETDAFEALLLNTPVTMEMRRHFLEVIAASDRHSTLELGFAAFFLNRTSRSGILAGGAIGGKAQSGHYRLDARYNKLDLVSRVRSIGARRSQITVLGMDALDLLRDCSGGFPRNSLVYLDPPYYVKGSQLYRNHYRHEDHEAIAACMTDADYPFLITYDNCAAIRELYAGLPATSFFLKYSTHTARPRATEVMFYGNLTLPMAPILTRGRHLSQAASCAV